MDMPAAFIALGELLRDSALFVPDLVEIVFGKMGGFDPKTRRPIENADVEVRRAWTDAMNYLYKATWADIAERSKVDAGDAALEKRFTEFRTLIMNEIKDFWLKWLKEHGGR